MLNDIYKSAEQHMKKSIEILCGGLIKMRTGRAHPSLLEHIMVSCYGESAMPLNQVASIAVGDPRMLLVTPWDKGLVVHVEKAILQADLGLNPVAAGQTIRVPLPPLTEERRKEMVKLVRSEGENSRVAIRNIRRDANSQMKDLLKEKAISEDEERRGEEQIQKLTNACIKEVDEIISSKEAELLAV